MERYEAEIIELYNYVLDPETKCFDSSYITLAPLSLIVEKGQMEESFCSMIFEKNYDLKMEEKAKNRILLTIFGLIVEVERSGKVTGNFDLATLLFESLSPSRGLNEENTMRILIRYARELIKVLKTDGYKSEIMDELKKQLKKKEAEEERYNQRKKFPTQYGLTEKEKPYFEEVTKRILNSGMQMIYSRVVSSFR